MVRCKMQLVKITEQSDWNGNVSPTKILRFECRYDQKIPEDRLFADASPSGSFEISVSNPAALAKFELGKSYYFDAITCDEPNA